MAELAAKNKSNKHSQRDSNPLDAEMAKMQLADFPQHQTESLTRIIHYPGSTNESPNHFLKTYTEERNRIRVAEALKANLSSTFRAKRSQASLYSDEIAFEDAHQPVLSGVGHLGFALKARKAPGLPI